MDHQQQDDGQNAREEATSDDAASLVPSPAQVAVSLFDTQSALLDLAQDAIIVRAMDGTIQSWNPAAATLYGWSAEEARGQRTHDLLRTRFPDSLDALNAALLASGLWEGELIHTRRDASAIVVHSRHALRRADAEGGEDSGTVLEINRDITERKRAEAAREAARAALAQRERDWQELTDLIPQIVWVSDDQGRSIFYNHRHAEYTGYSAAEMAGEDAWRKTIHPDDLPGHLTSRARTLAAGEPWQHEFRLRREDGAWRWHLGRAVPLYDEKGQVTRWLGTLTDIHDRKEGEMARERAEQRLTLALRAANAGVWEYDPATETSTWDLRARTLFGFDPADPVTRDVFWSRVHLDDRDAVRVAFQHALDPTHGRFDLEYRIVRSLTDETDGAVRWVQSVAQTFFDSQGRPLRMTGLVQDITGRKEGEEALRASERTRAEKMQHLADRQSHIAEAVQRSLLLVPEPDAYPGVTVQTLYQSAHEDVLVGGDFFDVFAVDEDRVALVVGDAMGKGIEAATYTAEVKFALRALLREHEGSPARALERLNAFVIENERLDAAHAEATSYVAMAAAVFNTRTGELAVATAGSEPPLIARPGRAGAPPMMEEVTELGILLGVAEGEPYAEQRLIMGVGDLFVLTTDGITEACRPVQGQRGRRREDFFGHARLTEAVREEASSPERPLPEIEQAVVGRALAWAGGVQHDDICLLLARRRPLLTAVVPPSHPRSRPRPVPKTTPPAPPNGGWRRRAEDPPSPPEESGG